ncbi:MAG: helix-turn-helix domain-containing protein [Clostridiales bacterium]|nr:helix-turn-helix domain-containing protein [Clostridiales bacterium]MCF8022457.1 helix-turn-helix domain-containing protein [Clostridiales bacterium]
MKQIERWQMYLKIQELKRLNLKISQIARHVGISRNTVYKYIDMTPEEFQQSLERRARKKTRARYLFLSLTPDVIL